MIGQWIRVGAAALCVTLLAGCLAVVPSTAARLSAMDPLTADPAAVEVAVIVPPGVRAREGMAMLILDAHRGDGPAREEAREEITLQERAVNLGALTVPEGAKVIAFRIPHADLARVRAVQRRVAVWKADTSVRGSGSFSVNVAFCAVGDGLAPDATFSVLIRTEAGAAFDPLIRNARLRNLRGAGVLDTLPPCEGAQ